MTRAIRIVVLALTLALPAAAAADECGDAVRDYNDILAQLHTANEEFTACVADSLGRKKCAREFARLQSAYRQYESAVAMYTRQCL
ncbi:hypothetical protein ASD45_03555 [Pseudolabrys sp. Root1462]|uniref:hypothetical protein n=1 Tax=Pseudolabrys sp. Root1462 TaxID=1736466 RepID=UPI000703503D|nr:hypothetical protein [Pseudolabrys sp. Root1462]KQY99978.1 hypothetical protein ASD45_03555 [Pseudolabrys sp. Root1462]